jgi:hypothetical protein
MTALQQPDRVGTQPEIATPTDTFQPAPGKFWKVFQIFLDMGWWGLYSPGTDVTTTVGGTANPNGPSPLLSLERVWLVPFGFSFARVE